jgi:hypothetical protein
MLKSVPIQGPRIARSVFPLGQASVTRRHVNAQHSLREQVLLSGNSSDNRTGAGSRSLLRDVAGYSFHGFGFLFLSFWTLYHFGQVFWFFSIVSAAVALISLRDAYTAFKGSRTPETKRAVR